MNEIEENTTTYDTHDNASELSSLSDIPTPVPISESTNYQTPSEPTRKCCIAHMCPKNVPIYDFAFQPCFMFTPLCPVDPTVDPSCLSHFGQRQGPTNSNT